MALDITFLYNQSNKTLNITIFQKNLLNWAFAKSQTFF